MVVPGCASSSACAIDCPACTTILAGTALAFGASDGGVRGATLSDRTNVRRITTAMSAMLPMRTIRRRVVRLRAGGAQPAGDLLS